MLHPGGGQQRKTCCAAVRLLFMCLCILRSARGVPAHQQATGVAAQASQNATGVSSLTIALLPVPSDMRKVMHFRCRIASRRALPAHRLLLEKLLRRFYERALPSTLQKARATTFTYIPAFTPGYESYNSITYEVDAYALRVIAPQTVSLSPRQVFLAAKFVLDLLRASFSNDTELTVMERYLVTTPTERAAQPHPSVTDTSQLTATTLSHIQLSGEGLLPFSAGKQLAIELGVLDAFSDSTNLYTLNTTLVAPPTAARARKLVQSAAPGVTLGVWTQSLAANYSAAGFWNKVFSGGALQSVGPLKLNLTGKFINATTQLRTLNETTLAVRTELPQGDGADSSDTSNESGSSLSGGAIAGIAIGCAAAAALLVAAMSALLCKRRRQRQPALECGAKAAAAETGANYCSTGTSDYLWQSKEAGPSFQSAAKLWSVDKFNGSSPADATGVVAVHARVAGRAPTLDAGDIQICIDACGKPLTLACTDGCRVYRGRHRQRDVAVKELSVRNRSAAAIQTEVRLAERLSRDANVVRFYGTAAMPHAVLLVMELMLGGDLRAALDGPCGTKFRWRARGARIATDIARGMAYIHSAGVVHRDLKSSNVLLTATGAMAKLADFGSAMLLGAMESADGKPRGTLAWASPELLAGAAVDAKTDVWSLGVVVWEVVTGETPVRGMMRDLKVPADCPAAVAQLVAACMAAQPADRPTAADVAEQLQALAAGSKM